MTSLLCKTKSQSPESTTKMAAEVAYDRQKCKLRSWRFKGQVFYILTRVLVCVMFLWQRGERLIT